MSTDGSSPARIPLSARSISPERVITDGQRAARARIGSLLASREVVSALDAYLVDPQQPDHGTFSHEGLSPLHRTTIGHLALHPTKNGTPRPPARLEVVRTDTVIFPWRGFLVKYVNTENGTDSAPPPNEQDSPERTGARLYWSLVSVVDRSSPRPAPKLATLLPAGTSAFDGRVERPLPTDWFVYELQPHEPIDKLLENDYAARNPFTIDGIGGMTQEEIKKAHKLILPNSKHIKRLSAALAELEQGNTEQQNKKHLGKLNPFRR